MKRQLTAADVKANVKRTLSAYGRKLNDKNMPYYFNDATCRMARDEALAYLEDDRFEFTPRARTAIKNWALDLKP